MPSHGAVPLELVYQVIDELAEDYRWGHDCFPYFTPRAYAYAALHACTLVSRNWTAYSRAHMFKKVKIDGNKSRRTATPPTSILPYVKELEVWYGNKPTEATSITSFLKAFVTAPLAYLGIKGGVLVDKRACIRESIDAHSATLETVDFESCSISAHNIADIVLRPHRLKTLFLVHCVCGQLPLPGQPLITIAPDHGVCSKPLGLRLALFGGHDWEGPREVVDMVARLPYRFSTLDISHAAAGHGTTEAMNALIKANADVVSSLSVHIWSEDMGVDIRPEHLFSLKDCSNLSELILNMEYSETCAIQEPIFVLSTLDPARSSRLGKIVLEVGYFARWFGEDDPVEYEKDGGDKKINWERLDTILSKLAKISISVEERRLTFILVVLEWCDNKRLTSTIREWLPELLPRFNELGSLHVHYGRGSRCRAVDNGLCRDL